MKQKKNKIAIIFNKIPKNILNTLLENNKVSINCKYFLTSDDILDIDDLLARKDELEEIGIW